MAVLVVNAGSTSLKVTAVEPDDSTAQVPSIPAARDLQIEAVGHRVVHGGARFRDAVELDDAVVEELEALTPIAPLHNRPALDAIAEARRALPRVPHVAVFDTGFHATLPEEAATYAVPARWREEWGVRRYGFHGLSVEWAAERVRVPRLVVCHLGGGCSVTAVADGRSVDTTMGFSPLEGVPMATRSGSVDPGALLYLLRDGKLDPAELDHALEYESGLAALGGLDDPLGFAVYTYRIATAVAAMAASLDGLDAVVFTAGVGENAPHVRRAVCGRLAHLGVALDEEANAAAQPDADVAAAGSGVCVVVLRAREDLVIARTLRDRGYAA